MTKITEAYPPKIANKIALFNQGYCGTIRGFYSDGSGPHGAGHIIKALAIQPARAFPEIVGRHHLIRSQSELRIIRLPCVHASPRCGIRLLCRHVGPLPYQFTRKHRSHAWVPGPVFRTGSRFRAAAQSAAQRVSLRIAQLGEVGLTRSAWYVTLNIVRLHVTYVSENPPCFHHPTPS